MGKAEPLPNADTSAAWLSRINAWLDLYKRGALSRRPEHLPDVLACIESEAIDGERVARLLPKGPARAAAMRVVMRLDLINRELTDELLAQQTDRSS